MEAAELEAFHQLPDIVKYCFGSPMSAAPKFDWRIRVWLAPYLERYRHVDGKVRNETGRFITLMLEGDASKGIMGMFERFPDLDPSKPPRKIDPKTEPEMYKAYMTVCLLLALF